MTEKYYVYEKGAEKPKHGPYQDEESAVRDAGKEQAGTHKRYEVIEEAS